MQPNSFRATFGVTPGYGEAAAARWQAQGLPALPMVVDAWDRAAREVEKAYNLYIAVVMTESRTVYKREWGCPTGGEITVTVTGTRNPEYVPDNLAPLWANAVRRCIETVQELLQQSTVTIELFEAKVCYLNNKPKEPTG